MARKQHSDPETPTFEQNLDRLEGIVKQLEEAEHRVEILTKTASGVVPEPLHDPSSEE